MRRICAAMALCGGAAAAAAQAVEPMPLKLDVEQPRAFGWRLGDVVERRLVVDVPERLKLDEKSLPAIARPGGVFELRAIDRRNRRIDGGERVTLTLRYQLFVSPRESRVYELPGFTLRFKGEPRDEEARVESWPVAAAPLTPIDASPREGLGELRPDAAPRLPDAGAPARRLVVWAAIALLLAAWLVHLHFGDRLWAARRRPFARAWRELSRLDPGSGSAALRDAQRRLHRAFDEAAGRALFVDSAATFARERALPSELQADVQGFFERSRATFFGSEQPGADDARRLRALARALRDAERASGGFA